MENFKRSQDSSISKEEPSDTMERNQNSSTSNEGLVHNTNSIDVKSPSSNPTSILKHIITKKKMFQRKTSNAEIRRIQRKWKTEKRNFRQMIEKKTISNQTIPHCLQVLTNQEFRNIQKNNIGITGYQKYKQIINGKRIRRTIYHVEEDNIGSNISSLFQNISQINEIDLSDVPRMFLTITLRVNQQIVNNSNIYLIGHGKVNSSSYILLMIATSSKTLDKKSTVTSLVDLFRKYRYSINKSFSMASHYLTKGEIYGLGLVAKYRIDDKYKSFGTYANKVELIEESDLKRMRDLIGYYLNNSFSRIRKIIPTLHNSSFLPSEAINDILQTTYSNEIEQEVSGERRNITLSTQLNINVTTQIEHTELDNSLTIIYIPNQPNDKSNFQFEFTINSFTKLQIVLHPGVTIIYSANMLTHRQIEEKKSSDIPSNDENNNGSCTFINISAYFNSRLFHNVKQSIIRKIQSELPPKK